MNAKREIKFVLTDAEIRLLTEVDEHFALEFGGKALSKRYEFTYSREALESLGFRVTGHAWFIAPKRDRHKFDQLVAKLNRLRQMSDALSEQIGTLREAV